jgi:hypothetical protein
LYISADIICSNNPNESGNKKWERNMGQMLFPASPQIGITLGTQITGLSRNVKIWNIIFETNTKIILYVTEC